ncbi:MAG: hypothetical protein CSB44_02435 [Gammaproteobacteria bacterium]|nr:MAG: hypothetical protein CSB44_02435 [Gammaproteobacteria bacterium]
MARSSDAVFPLSLLRDRAFQLRQTRRLLWLTGFFILQSTLVLGVFYHHFLGDLVSGNAPLLFTSDDMVNLDAAVPALGEVLGRWLLVMLAINAVVTGAIGIYIIRRLGNPMLAIHRALNEIGDGNLGVRLRTGDENEFSELCEALNRALESVQGRITEARALTLILDTVEDQPPPDAVELREALLACREVLSHFDGTARGDSGVAANAAHPDRAVGD